MTTIIAVENSDHVLIGCDSQATSGYESNTLEGGKIVTNGEYVIGVAGRLRMLQGIQYAKLPDIPSGISGSDLDDFVSTKLGPAIQKTEKRLDCAQQSIYLFVVRGRVYTLMGDGAFLHAPEKVSSVGSGSSYALGSLLSVAGEPKEGDVRKALEAASRKDIHTSGPFRVLRVAS